MWIFGYGSLIWKVDFPYSEKKKGYVKGYVRRFWQGSHDHRGCPDKPGRVVTLVPSTNTAERVYGIAYRIEPEVWDHLDYREKNGYTKVTISFYPTADAGGDGDCGGCGDGGGGHPPFDVCFYIASPDNEAFLGEAPLPEIARHVRESEGPSGTNLEYVINLCAAYQKNFPLYPDHHLDELSRHLQ